jgi:hypothetical protein
MIRIGIELTELEKVAPAIITELFTTTPYQEFLLLHGITIPDTSKIKYKPITGSQIIYGYIMTCDVGSTLTATIYIARDHLYTTTGNSNWLTDYDINIKVSPFKSMVKRYFTVDSDNMHYHTFIPDNSGAAILSQFRDIYVKMQPNMVRYAIDDMKARAKELNKTISPYL